jgi:hypothetical protein
VRFKQAKGGNQKALEAYFGLNVIEQALPRKDDAH